jgi:hypothetical protein
MANGTVTPQVSAPPISVVNKFPATSPYTFGSTNETGIAVDTYEQNDTCDKFEQKNEVGNVVEVVTHNMRSEITCSGEISAAMASIVGQIWTPTNLILQQYGGTSTGVAIVSSVANSKGRAKNMSVRITATFYPLLTA